MKGRGGLGRGLGALIPAVGPGLVEIPLEAIEPSTAQPRQTMDEAALVELAESIREHGLLQPILVTAVDVNEGRYRLVAGERRWRAAQRAGLATVPALVVEATPQQALEMALVENLQRRDLSPLEEAAAYRELVDGFGLTQEQVAQRVGRSRAAVANTLRLLQLPAAAREALAGGELSEGHARALLGAPDERTLLAALATVRREGLNVRQAEALVRRLSAAPERRAAERAPQADPETRAVEAEIERALGTRVQLIRSGKGGRLVLHFYSEEELSGLFDLLVGRGG